MTNGSICELFKDGLNAHIREEDKVLNEFLCKTEKAAIDAPCVKTSEGEELIIFSREAILDLCSLSAIAFIGQEMGKESDCLLKSIFTEGKKGEIEGHLNEDIISWNQGKTLENFMVENMLQKLQSKRKCEKV